MRPFAPRRRRTASALVALLVTLAACGAERSEPPAPSAAKTMSAAAPSPASFVAELEKTPQRAVRVLVTLRADPKAMAEVTTAAKSAGAASVQALGAMPILVIEGKAAHVRAALATGHVIAIQNDDAAPTN